MLGAEHCYRCLLQSVRGTLYTMFSRAGRIKYFLLGFIVRFLAAASSFCSFYFQLRVCLTSSQLILCSIVIKVILFSMYLDKLIFLSVYLKLFVEFHSGTLAPEK